jgi:hypothetical protein
MNRDELLRKLAETVADDDGLVLEGWRHLVLVSKMEAGTPDMTGFCYLADGRAIPVSPKEFAIFDVLEQLRDVMAAADAAGRPWLAALFRIASETGELTAEFEYERYDRWAVTPANAAQRAREFAPD